MCNKTCSSEDIICANPTCSTFCHITCLDISCKIFEFESIFWFCKNCASTFRRNKAISTQEHTQSSVSLEPLISPAEPVTSARELPGGDTVSHNPSEELSDVVLSLGNQVSSLTLKNTDLESRLDTLESYSKRLELEITGIPYCKQENLSDIFSRICLLLGVSAGLGDTTHVTRVKPFGNSNVRKPIVVGFLNRRTRDHFLRSAKTCPNLTLVNLGFDVANYRFFVNEHLTTLKKNILYRVRRLKDLLCYRRFFVRANRIFLVLQDDRVLDVRNHFVLDSLVRGNNRN